MLCSVSVDHVYMCVSVRTPSLLKLLPEFRNSVLAYWIPQSWFCFSLLCRCQPCSFKMVQVQYFAARFPSDYKHCHLIAWHMYQYIMYVYIAHCVIYLQEETWRTATVLVCGIFFIPRTRGYCFHFVCLSVCLSVCPSVCPRRFVRHFVRLTPPRVLSARKRNLYHMKALDE